MPPMRPQSGGMPRRPPESARTALLIDEARATLRAPRQPRGGRGDVGRAWNADSRTADDPAIALLDAAAVCGEVLSFITSGSSTRAPQHASTPLAGRGREGEYWPRPGWRQRLLAVARRAGGHPPSSRACPQSRRAGSGEFRTDCDPAARSPRRPTKGATETFETPPTVAPERRARSSEDDRPRKSRYAADGLPSISTNHTGLSDGDVSRGCRQPVPDKGARTPCASTA